MVTPRLSNPPVAPPVGVSAARRAWWGQPAMYAAFAVFAAVTVMVTHLEPHRVWGRAAVIAYGLAACATLLWRSRHRDTIAAMAVGGAVLFPLVVLVAAGLGQPEVAVVQRSGEHLLAHGTPYLGPDDLAGVADYRAYNPYLPGMALFGVPWAVAGIDARPVFAAVFLVAMGSAARSLRGRALPDASLLLFASPLVALPLVVGGDDLPVIGLACLGLTWAARGRPGAAGLVLGCAAALKATAWPVLAVAFVLVLARGGARRFAGVAGAVAAVGIVPVLLADPGGFVENVVRFPLGLAGVESPADSPMPGRLLAGLGTYGHVAALVLLVLAALAMAVSLLVRPPRDLRSAALRLALGLLLAAALMPATRWGYLVYPAVLACWAHFGGRPWRAA
ncbi:glycosyltransferase 87 family protein [Spirillospora sp. CA-253888]